MKKFLLTLLAAIGFIPSTQALAQAPGGLEISLNAGGYQFLAGDSLFARTPSVFPASASLLNRSGFDIPFTFANPYDAGTHFKFSVIDATGKVRWISDSDVISPAVIATDILKTNTQWKRSVEVPLKVGDAWLDPGTYTLETSVGIGGAPAASVIFTVAAANGSSGISGQVVRAGLVPIPAATILPRPVRGVKSWIQIDEIRLPNARYDHPTFSWSGVTDDNGAFKAFTPPYQFVVTATEIAPSGSSAAQASAKVSVQPGQFSSVTLSLPPAPPQPGTGIHGLVLIGPVRPVEIVGKSNEKPLAGALVEITEYQQPGVEYFRGPRTWKLTAGPDGRFTQAAPPGKYIVTASIPPTVPAGTVATKLRFGTGTAEVIVPANGFAKVTVHVDSGIR